MSLKSIEQTGFGKLRKGRTTVGCCLGAILLVVLMLAMASPALAASDFPDVPSSYKYHTAITDLASRGVIGGYTSGEFGPNNPVTRQQFAKMIVLAGGYPVSEADICPFVDVQKSDGATFYPDNYVAVCAAKGITTGKTETIFDPTGNITRYQVVTMVVRAADNLRPGLLVTPPAGWSGNATWAGDATHGANAARAEHNGLLTGLDLGSLAPLGNMTRGEVAQILHNLLGKLGAAQPETGSWVRLNPAGTPPAARWGHSMVYDTAAGKAILFGGMDSGGQFLNDTWAYDPAANAWARLLPSGASPAGRWGHSMVYDSTRGEVILFGGHNYSGMLGDAWAYSASANTWTPIAFAGGAPPSARAGHAMVYDPVRRKVILFGGEGTGGFGNDTWTYDPAAKSWIKWAANPGGSSPSARLGHCMVYDSAQGKVVLFGGANHSLTMLADTWTYDPATNTWSDRKPGGSPAAREFSAMAYDAGAGKAVLFGGDTNPAALGDTRAYDAASNTWTSVSLTGGSPSARGSHAMVYVPGSGKVILFGGADSSGAPLADTWTYGG